MVWRESRMWSPVTKFLVGAAAVVGIGYAVTRKPKKRKKKGAAAPAPSAPGPESEPEPSPEPPPPSPPPGGVAGPGVPPRHWQTIFNENVDAAIKEGRAESAVITGLDLQTSAAQSVFPRAVWPPPETTPKGSWQRVVWQELYSILYDLAGAKSWPFSGQRPVVDAAITFYASAAKNLKACRAEGAVEIPAQLVCTASRTYPDETWPPSADLPQTAWQHTAWDRLLTG